MSPTPHDSGQQSRHCFSSEPPFVPEAVREKKNVPGRAIEDLVSGLGQQAGPWLFGRCRKHSIIRDSGATRQVWSFFAVADEPIEKLASIGGSACEPNLFVRWNDKHYRALQIRDPISRRFFRRSFSIQNTLLQSGSRQSSFTMALIVVWCVGWDWWAGKTNTPTKAKDDGWETMLSRVFELQLRGLGVLRAISSLTLLAPFHACRQGISDDLL
jgi:hypothetical protein